MSTPIEGTASLGFRVWRGSPRVMARSHLHSDIEINFVVSGAVEYFFGGRFQLIKPDEASVFWAGMPHALTRVEKATEMMWAVVPLAWFLQWDLRADFTDRLLRGQMINFPHRDELSKAQFARWSDDFSPAQTSVSLQKILALEVEAALRRLALETKINATRRRMSTPAAGATHAQIEKLATLISRHYRDDLTIREIARKANLHPNYAMQLFKERCGLSLWDYVLRLRVSHAQYLLLSSNRTMSDIARASGFASPSRFYAAFEKYCNAAPRAWREMMTDTKK